MDTHEADSIHVAGDGSRPVVAHCADPFLEITTVWLYDQMRSLHRYRPIVLTQTVRNASLFPFGEIHDLSQVHALRRSWHRLRRKFSGQHQGYAKVMRREGAVVAHAHYGHEGFRCLSAASDAGVPLVTTFYGFDASSLPNIPVWRNRMAALFERGDLFLAEGPAMAERIERLGCPGTRIRVLRLGTDLANFNFAAPSQRSNKKSVLMYASFREKKGHLYGVRAFARAFGDDGEATLDLVGDGPLREATEAEVDRLGIGERVRFHGTLPHEAAIRILEACSVLLYPSLTAEDGDTEGGAPVALLEAMACGTPIVSSRHADIPFVAPEGACSLLADERDVGALSEALVAVVTDEALGDRLATSGRERVESHHNLEKQARALEGVYDEVRA